MHDPLLPESPEERDVVSGVPRAHDLEGPLHLRRIQDLLPLVEEEEGRENRVGGRGGEIANTTLCELFLRSGTTYKKHRTNKSTSVSLRDSRESCCGRRAAGGEAIRTRSLPCTRWNVHSLRPDSNKKSQCPFSSRKMSNRWVHYCGHDSTHASRR